MDIKDLIAGAVVGEEPPEASGASGKYDELASFIRMQAGAWVKLPGHWNTGWSSLWNNGQIGGIEEGEFQAVMRNTFIEKGPKLHPDGSEIVNEDGSPVIIERRKGDVWIRYVGDQKPKFEGMSEAEINSLGEFMDYDNDPPM